MFTGGGERTCLIGTTPNTGFVLGSKLHAILSCYRLVVGYVIIGVVSSGKFQGRQWHHCDAFNGGFGPVNSWGIVTVNQHIVHSTICNSWRPSIFDICSANNHYLILCIFQLFGELCQKEDASFEGRLSSLGVCLRQYARLRPLCRDDWAAAASELGHDIFV